MNMDLVNAATAPLVTKKQCVSVRVGTRVIGGTSTNYGVNFHPHIDMTLVTDADLRNRICNETNRCLLLTLGFTFSFLSAKCRAVLLLVAAFVDFSDTL
jgi:hypothetical protein